MKSSEMIITTNTTNLRQSTVFGGVWGGICRRWNAFFENALFDLELKNKPIRNMISLSSSFKKRIICFVISYISSNELGAGYNSFSLPALMTSSLPRGPITLDWTLDLGLWLAPAVQISNWIWEMAQFYNHCQPETDPSMERERLLTNNHVTLPRWLHIVGFPPHAGCWWCHWPH